MSVHLPNDSNPSLAPVSQRLAEPSLINGNPALRLSQFAVSQIEQLAFMPSSATAAGRAAHCERGVDLPEIEETNSKNFELKKKKATDLNTKNSAAISGIQKAEKQIKILQAQMNEFKQQLRANHGQEQSLTRDAEEQIQVHRRTISLVTQQLKTAKMTSETFVAISNAGKAERRIKSLKADIVETGQQWAAKGSKLKKSIQEIGAQIRLLEAQIFESRQQIQQNTIDILGLNLGEELKDTGIKQAVDPTKLANPNKRKRGTFLLSSATSLSFPSIKAVEKERKAKDPRLGLH